MRLSGTDVRPSDPGFVLSDTHGVSDRTNPARAGPLGQPTRMGISISADVSEPCSPTSVSS